MSWFKDEDETDKALDAAFGKKPKRPLCLKKYKAKAKDGKTVTRTCIKPKGHWFGHQ